MKCSEVGQVCTVWNSLKLLPHGDCRSLLAKQITRSSSPVRTPRGMGNGRDPGIPIFSRRASFSNLGGCWCKARKSGRSGQHTHGGEHLDLSSGYPGHRPTNQGDFKRRFIGIHFACCEVYARIYVNSWQTAYEGRRPRCLRPVRVGIGPQGVRRAIFHCVLSRIAVSVISACLWISTFNAAHDAARRPGAGELAPGEAYYSVLIEQGTSLVRQDYSRGSMERAAGGGNRAAEIAPSRGRRPFRPLGPQRRDALTCSNSSKASRRTQTSVTYWRFCWRVRVLRQEESETDEQGAEVLGVHRPRRETTYRVRAATPDQSANRADSGRTCPVCSNEHYPMKQSRLLLTLTTIVGLFACSGATCMRPAAPPLPVVLSASPTLGQIIEAVNRNSMAVQSLVSNQASLERAGLPHASLHVGLSTAAAVPPPAPRRP